MSPKIPTDFFECHYFTGESQKVVLKAFLEDSSKEKEYKKKIRWNCISMSAVFITGEMSMDKFIFILQILCGVKM